MATDGDKKPFCQNRKKTEEETKEGTSNRCQNSMKIRDCVQKTQKEEGASSGVAFTKRDDNAKLCDHGARPISKPKRKGITNGSGLVLEGKYYVSYYFESNHAYRCR